MNENRENRVSDKALVARSQRGDERAREILMERYTPLVKSLCREHFTSSFREDLEQELWLAFFALVDGYDPGKAEFATAARKALRYRRQNLFKEKKKTWNREVADANGIFYEIAYDRYPQLEEEIAEDLIRRMALSPRQREALGVLMDEAMPNAAALGRKLGISQQRAHRILRQIQEKAEKILGEGV